MPQKNVAAILAVALVAIIIVVVVIAVVLSGPPAAGPQYPNYPGNTQYPGNNQYPGTPSSTSWCVAGQTTSLASYGAQGSATFNGMAAFQGQSLCKATLSTNGQTYYFYTNEAGTVWYTTDTVGNIVSSSSGQSGQQPQTPQNELINTALNSLSLTSGQEGTVSTSTGASVRIPAGAVPLGQNGQAGTMVFSVNERNDVTPTFPTGFLPASPVYELGPEGFNFELPVQVTLPIQQGVDPSTVGGLAYYDDATQKWIRVPGTVDPTAGTVSTYTTHFSFWTTWSSTSWHDQMNQQGGWLRVVNNHMYETGSYNMRDKCLGKPITINYGVCIKSWVPSNPQDSTWWNAKDQLVMAHDEPSRESEAWVPAGAYELVEIVSVSEVNHDPLYVPCYSQYWKNSGIYNISKGQTQTFSDGSYPPVDNTWTLATPDNPPPCWGVKTAAGGTGDVQVTLTWHSSVDLDLHVTDPRSEEIYYNNDESSSGGKLDIDNKCSNFVMGKPENVFWPTGGAPSGTYKVVVRYYTECDDSGPVSYTVRVVAKGHVSTYSGTLSTSGDDDEVTTFSI